MKQLAFIAASAAILTGLWFWLKPQPAPAAPAAIEQGPPVSFQLRIEGNEISGPSTLKVQQGDAVQIHVLSDRADELHLHGYDLHVELKPGVEARLAFVADRSGRFELELHKSHRAIGNLEVYPPQ